MFVHLSALLPIAAFVVAVAAVPNALEARWDTPSSSQCNGGEIQCCQSTETANPITLGELGGLLGILLPNVEGLIGLTCTPLTLIGTGTGAACTEQTVCCTNNNFNGVVSLGCTPVNLNL